VGKVPPQARVLLGRVRIATAREHMPKVGKVPVPLRARVLLGRVRIATAREHMPKVGKVALRAKAKVKIIATTTRAKTLVPQAKVSSRKVYTTIRHYERP